MHPHKYSLVVYLMCPHIAHCNKLLSSELYKAVVNSLTFILVLFLTPYTLYCFLKSTQLSSFCLYFPHLSTPLQCVRHPHPGCGLVLAKQWAMQAFFPHSGLLSGVFALTCVQLGLLYPHY